MRFRVHISGNGVNAIVVMLLLLVPCLIRYPTMGISKTEVNLLRLLDSAPRQQNQAKLIHVSISVSRNPSSFIVLVDFAP